MEAGTRICSHCGLRRLTETECPACGSPTYAPHDPQAVPLPTAETEKPAAAGSPVAGLAVALIGAGALLASLSMPWYAVELPSGLRGLFESAAEQFGAGELARGLEANAWEAFELADIALAAAAGVTFIVIAATLLARLKPADATRILQGVGGFVIGLTLFRMIDQPDPAPLLSVETGAWVALVAGGVIVLGSGLTTARAR